MSSASKDQQATWADAVESLMLLLRDHLPGGATSTLVIRTDEWVEVVSDDDDVVEVLEDALQEVLADSGELSALRCLH